jgi:hypothetical protein
MILSSDPKPPNWNPGRRFSLPVGSQSPPPKSPPLQEYTSPAQSPRAFQRRFSLASSDPASMTPPKTDNPRSPLRERLGAVKQARSLDNFSIFEHIMG